MQKILVNKIKCNKCGDVIESTHRHDFKFCQCGTVAVDGGKDYIRRCFKDSADDFTDLSEYEEVEDTMDCPFCKIIYKVARAHVIHESDTLIALLDIDPINEGHVLIIPKLHEASIDKMPIELLTEIMDVAQRIVAALKNIYPMNGYSIMQNGGEFCDFGHGHFHVFPRYKGDGFGWKYPQGPFECSERVAEQLRNALEEG